MILQKINNRSGFTLVELLIVIAIIMIALTILVPMVFEIADSVNNSNSDIQIIEQSKEPQKITDPTQTEQQEDEKL